MTSKPSCAKCSKLVALYLYLADSYSRLQEQHPELGVPDSLRPEIADLQAMRDEAWQKFCNHVTREHRGVSPALAIRRLFPN